MELNKKEETRGTEESSGGPTHAGHPDQNDKPGSESHSMVPQTEETPIVVVDVKRDQKSTRSIIVDDFLRRCNQEPGLGEKIGRKHIWGAVGHSAPRQFQYWQSNDPNATAEDEKNFGRILAMQPADFVADLKKRNLLKS